MIKRVIFDIDNTLMPWKAEYFSEIYTVLNYGSVLQAYAIQANLNSSFL